MALSRHEKAIGLYKEIHALEASLERKTSELSYLISIMEVAEFSTYAQVTTALDRRYNLATKERSDAYTKA